MTQHNEDRPADKSLETRQHKVSVFKYSELEVWETFGPPILAFLCPSNPLLMTQTSNMPIHTCVQER